MIEYKKGNILIEDADAIINTVNCVGVMGRGIALQFKKSFPENFKAYAAACKREEVQPGRMFIYDMGGLEWAEVRQHIEQALSDMDDVRIIIFEPNGAPIADKMVRNREVPKMTPGRAALVELMHRYLGGLLDPFVTLLEVHKLMYFMQEAGEPLRLKYQKTSYGPYAENLRHVLNAIEGHLVSGYADGGDAPDKPLQLVPGAINDAAAFLEENVETRKRFEQVTELVEGFESAFGLELLATVHWVMKHEGINSIEDIVKHTYAWSARKQRFTRRQITLAVGVLSQKNWVGEGLTSRST